jgi:hypothetical protein
VTALKDYRSLLRARDNGEIWDTETEKYMKKEGFPSMPMDNGS